MNLTVQDTEKMVADIENLEKEIGDAYLANGQEKPAPERIAKQAHAMWTYMTIRGVLQQAQHQAQEAAAKKPARPAIILPNGRPPR